MIRLIYFLPLLLFVACSDSNSRHTAFEYFPAQSVLEKGYVNKYYRHYIPSNTDMQTITEVTYSKTQLINDSTLLVQNYNAGYDLSGTTRILLEDPYFLAISAMEISREDTFDIEIIQSELLSWSESPEAVYHLKYDLEGKTYLLEQRQISIGDTIIEGRRAKLFVKETQTIEEETGVLIRQQIDSLYYVADLGYYSSKSVAESYTIISELIEQMPIEEFEGRRNHGEHRIAWINPERTLDAGDDFNICGHERFIADYYNSEPDGRYIHDKRALKDTIFSNLDESKLFNENGRLVFRFVVNCEGVAGRFVAEGYDLDYQPKTFNPVTIEHLYSLVQKLEEWRPVVLDGEPRDAYFYLTFNLKNGKITDILP